MFTSDDRIRIRRFGRDMVVPANEVLMVDQFMHSGKWWKMTTITRCFVDLDNSDIFRYEDHWYRADKIGEMMMAIVLEPNIPLGEPAPDLLPPAILPMANVEYLALQIIGPEEKA